jgi:predicted DNA-binding WGR domain protein
MMRSVLLHKVNHEKNQARFYLVVVGRSLLDRHAVLRVYGRIGGHQRTMCTPCDSADEAQSLADRLIKRRLRHGYEIVEIPPSRRGYRKEIT